MLENTFIHIERIGPKTESKLWSRGIQTWHQFLGNMGTVFSPSRDEAVRRQLEGSIEHLGDIRFFVDRLPPAEIWRVFETFKGRAVYLDIETSGGYEGVVEITLVGLYDGSRVGNYINGINLDQFETAIADYDLVITFNGSRFDLPLIRHHFRHIRLPPAHIDLCFFLRRLGYRGGLKRIEKELGVMREPEIDGMNGYDAVRLWRAYRWGDENALDRLKQYNTADIVNLKPLMEWGYEEMKSRLLPDA